MSEITEIIKGKDFAKIKELFNDNRPKFDVESKAGSTKKYSEDYQQRCINEYKVENHNIFDTSLRADKIIKKDSGESDANGNPVMVSATSPVARIGIPMQKLIVERRVGFMLSDPVEVRPIYSSENEAEKKLEKIVERIQNDNKMDYRNKEIARRMMSELECAELWYFVENKEPDSVLSGKQTLKMRLLSPDQGDTLYPLFDATGDMVAFARGYKLKGKDKKEIEHFDVYTDEAEYRYVNTDNVWKIDEEVQVMTKEGMKVMNPIPNPVKKIMVIYHTQPRAEWNDVQSMIDRLEESISNHADMNDYFGSPILAVAGKILGFAAKGEQGKIIELAEQAKANYLALDSPPESIKMELENLDRLIYAMSQTPNISFEQLMNIGGQLSGIALKMMFLDAHMAVKSKEEIFGIGLQRRLNLLKTAIGTVIDTSLAAVTRALQLKPVITPYLPQNTTEDIENLTVAKTGGIMSIETAVSQNPLVEDAEAEVKLIQQDRVDAVAGME